MTNQTGRPGVRAAVPRNGSAGPGRICVALEKASTPNAADKVVVTSGWHCPCRQVPS
jgi:hypothetical protein